jgi:hypothetical protein
MFVCVRVRPWLIYFFLWFIIHNGRWLQVRVLQHLQRRSDDRMLVLVVAGCTERVAVAKRDDQRAWGLHFYGDTAQQLNCHRRDTLALEFGREQTHGLVAYRSNRHQQGDIDTVFNQPAHSRRCGFLYQAAGGCNGSHAGQVPTV